MDWARDNAGLNDHDLDKVFKYEPKQTTAVSFLAGQSTPCISSLETDLDWSQWLSELPSPQNSRSGLVLVLAKRAGEREYGTVSRIDSDKWLAKIAQDGQKRTRAQKISSFAMLSEKPSPKDQEKDPEMKIQSEGRRSVRTLPFAKKVFWDITQKFLIHGSIARAISRSDIPVFSSAQVDMGGPDGSMYSAYVYNCRTSHEWEIDLAVTATYFPHSGLTYAILFGCPVAIEEEVIKRLCLATAEAAHPLVIPGILAELERNRHIHVVDKTISHLETQTWELRFQHADMEGPRDMDAEDRNHEKREAWLDTTYLRNGLINWKTQLGKMAEHVDELREDVFKDIDRSDTERHAFSRRMIKTGVKIRRRMLELVEEYDDKIRDCTMRVDGMAMATQWTHGETNVEIALATGRDSRQMRSLALITMVFLPGTFFATVFSMTFFNWAASGTPLVSPFIWIYFVVTASFTFLTVGSWYYFVVHRPSRGGSMTDEECPPA